MNLGKAFSRKLVLACWLFALAFSAIASSQTWFTIEMFPDGKTVELQQFDGLTAYPFLNAIYMAGAAGLLAVVFVQTVARKIVGAISLLIAAAGLCLTVSRVFTQDLSAIAKQLETLTGIAASHGVGNYDVTTTSWPWITFVTLVAQVLILAILLLTESSWPARAPKTERRTLSDPASDLVDSIDMWDSQRK